MDRTVSYLVCGGSSRGSLISLDMMFEVDGQQHTALVRNSSLRLTTNPAWAAWLEPISKARTEAENKNLRLLQNRDPFG